MRAPNAKTLGRAAYDSHIDVPELPVSHYYAYDSVPGVRVVVVELLVHVLSGKVANDSVVAGVCLCVARRDDTVGVEQVSALFQTNHHVVR